MLAACCSKSAISSAEPAWSDTAGALRAICDLDLSDLDSVEPPRGFGRDRSAKDFEIRLQVLTLEVPVGEKLEHPLFHRDPRADLPPFFKGAISKNETSSPTASRSWLLVWCRRLGGCRPAPG